MDWIRGRHPGLFRGYRHSPYRYLILAALLLTAAGLTAGTAWQSFGEEHNPFSSCATPVLFLVLLAWQLGKYWGFLDKATFAEAERCRQARQLCVPVGAVTLAAGVFWAVLTVKSVLLFHSMMSASLAAASAALRREEWLTLALGTAKSAFLLFVALSQLWLWRHASRKLRRLESRCERCGYLLTGLPEPRCPECGTTSSESCCG